MKTVIVSENLLFGEVIRESAKECLGDELAQLNSNAESDEINLLESEVMILDESLPKEVKERFLSAACRLPKCRILMVNLFNNDFVVLDSTRSTLQKVNDLKNALALGTGKNDLDSETPSEPPVGPTMAGGEDDVTERGNRRDKPQD